MPQKNNIKETQAKALLKQHPKLLTILMDNLVIRGEPGGEVASIKSTDAIDKEFQELNIREVKSLNTFFTTVLTHLDLRAVSVDVKTGGFNSSAINVVFNKPALLIALAEELNIPLTGVLAEKKDDLTRSLTGSGKGFGGR